MKYSSYFCFVNLVLMSCRMFVTKLSLMSHSSKGKEKKKNLSWFRSKNKVFVWRQKCRHFGRWKNAFDGASRRVVSWLQCQHRQQLSRPLQRCPRRLLSHTLRDAVLASASSFSFQAFVFGSVRLGYAFGGFEAFHYWSNKFSPHRLPLLLRVQIWQECQWFTHKEL